MITALTDEQRQHITAIANDHGLDLVVLFGSIARGNTHAQSDFDVAVRGRERCDLHTLVTIERAIKKIVRRPVDVVDLRATPPLLAGRIARDGVLLVGDARTFARVRMELIARHLDFLPFLHSRGDALRRTFRPRPTPV